MRIHDFGLWFNHLYGDELSTTIPPKGPFRIYYDGFELGTQLEDFDLYLIDYEPHLINLKLHFPLNRWSGDYKIGHLLTHEDFEIIPNPNYKGYYEVA